MKKTLFYTLLLVPILFAGFLPAMAQTPGVMQMQQSNFNTWFDLGIELKADLLDPGNPGEASLEFWIKSTQGANLWTLTDLNPDNGHFSLSMAGENQLTLQLGVQSHTVDLTNEVQSGLWHHIALVIWQGSQVLEMYVNGIKQGHYNLDLSGARELYFYKGGGSELFITEIRGWSKRRLGQDIGLGQWRSFITQSPSQLTSLKNNEGLEVLYGNDDHQIASPMAGIGQLDRISWKNIQSGAYSAGLISNYDAQAMAELRNDTNHPVFNLDQILVRATKGSFADKIQLTWPHVENVTQYQVRINGTLDIDFNPDLQGIPVSEMITYNDPDVLPNEIYTYQVTGLGDNSFNIQGTDRGFIFPNGRISGNIATQSAVFVENVQLRAVGATPTGSALEFNPGDGPVVINNIEVFRNQAAFSVEFWYKGDASPRGTPFQLGDLQISFTGGNIEATNGDGSAYLSATAATDGLWHHYSVVFSDSGSAIYRDGAEITGNASPFAINLASESNFKLNASSPVSPYRLDELRIWNTALDAGAIASRYDHILCGSEENLSIYYRFDMGDAQGVYNQADATKGIYIGSSASDLNWLAAADQPPALAYGSFTDSGGNYTLASINAGTDAGGLGFTVSPSKPNHTFNPGNRGVTIARSLNAPDYEKEADFIDISSLPVAGKVFYDENGTEYPVPAGAAITLDGQLVVGADPNLVTDAFGVFTISAPLGLHQVAVDNPLTSHSMGMQSLYFDGIDDYAETEKSIDFQRNGSFSGWIKKDTATAAVQTIMQAGDIRIVLKNNQTLALMEGQTEVITASDQIGDNWHFFALSYDDTTKEAVLYSGVSFYQATLTNPNLNGRFVLGATRDTSTSMFYQGNMHLVEYREGLYDASLMEDLRLGDHIAGDQQTLWFSFRFTESAGALLRSVSLAPGAQDYVLVCHGPVIDTQTVNTYTRKTRYDYRAEGPFAEAEKQVFNVVEPVTGLRFYNDTRYGVVGNIVIPCGYNIGPWDIRLERTDIVSPAFEKTTAVFNDDHTVFVVDSLLPGQYKAYLTNQGDPSIQLESGVLDITQGWVAREFAYRNPMTLEMEVIAVVDSQEQLEVDGQPMLSLNTVPYDMANYCSDTYIMDSGRGYVISLETYEQYGADKCYVEGVQYDIDGDLAHIVATTAGSGKDTLLIKALEPNFLSPFTRAMQVSASHDGRNRQQSLNAYVTGTKQFSTDFTLEAPPNIVAVVHDPPGDGSSATLSQGTSFSFSQSITHAGGMDIAVDVSTGTDVEHYTGYFAGLGGGVIGMTKIVDSQVNALFQVAESFRLGDTDSKNYEISLNQTISTSSGSTLPGYPSDVYVGYSPIIHMGSGKRMRMQGCTPISEDVTDVIRPDRTPLFSLTHQHIKDVTIPGLQTLRDATSDPDSTQMYQDHIDGWLNILASNEANWNNVQNMPQFQLRNTQTNQVLSFENSIAFSAGSNISYSLSDRNSDGSGFSAESNTSLSKTFNKSFMAFGAAVNLKIDAKGFYNYSENSQHAQTNGKNFGFTLSDDDIGDQFDVLIRKDTTYAFATPVFKAVAGRSMCPAERNTQPREGVEISSDKAVGFAGMDEQAVFNLTLANTQVADEEAGNGYYKNFRIKVYDSKGAIIRYNGGLLSESGQLVVLDTQGPQAIKDSIPLTVERNPATPEKVDFDDIAIVFFSQCEENGGSLGFYDGFAGVKLVDTLYVSARFHRPCVETINLTAPTPDWVVNQTSNNELTFVFSIDNPEASFDNLLVEYANQGSNIPQLLQEVDPATLVPDASGNYSLTVDVSGIADGQYQFRLTPQCGLGSEPWRGETSSPWVSGSIYRIAPIITGVYPAHNSVMSSGTISASYDRDLSPAGVNSLSISLRGILGGLDYLPKSAEFDLMTDQITVPHQPAIALDSAYTVEFWVNPSAFANNGDKVPIVEKGSGLGIYLTHEGKIDNGRGISSEALTPFKWTHVAVVYDGGNNVKTYFDTQLVYDAPANMVPYQASPDALTIGAAFSGDAFRGQIDEVRLWNTARSVAQIATYRSERLLGNEDHLMAYYVLDDIALEGEGVRDFTGKTSGTVATGISWVEGDAAAPIVVEKVIQDVPIDAILSGGNQILIAPKPNFPEYYIEGAELTAFIADNVVEDLYGNPALGTSWSFVVNKNAVQWAQSNHLINQTEGVASTFDMDLTNNGAIDVTYAFNDLPVWLSVSNDPGAGSLNYGFTHSIGFEVAPWLNPGKHETYVKATILDPGGGQLGVEQFFLEVNVTCPEPAYSVNPAQYGDQISLTARLNVAGERSQDENDRVYAYLGSELRGVGQLSLSGGEWLVSMIIYGNVGDNGALDFRVWDASQCKEYQGVIENHTYQGGINIGSLANPATLTTGEVLSKSLSLPAGYHWVSFNMSDQGQSSLGLTALTGMATGDQITDQQGGTATYDQASGWSGSLTSLDHKAHYLVYLTQATTLQFQGIPASENTDIAVAAGPTWAGYIPERMIQTGRAVISLSNTTATNGDQVQGKEGFAEFLNGTWIGSLTHLTPNRGYRIISAQAGTLNYFGIAGYASKQTAIKGAPITQSPMFELREKAAQRGWTVSAHDYPQVMYITGVIEDNDHVNPQNGHIIGAFEGENCTGVAIPQIIDGKLHYFMNLYGKTDQQEISFKLIDGTSGKVYTLSNSISFSGGQRMGSYKQPYKWEILKAQEPQPETGPYRLHKSYPNPFTAFTNIAYELPKTAQIEISVWDMTGRKVKTLVKGTQQKGAYQLKWYGQDNQGKRIPQGIYIITMKTPTETLNHKVIRN